ncbi:MAG: YtxH domain-containing protein [Bacilli bacterium]|nr:YtxH domain-containing protein [Bacilli bacterium]
MKMSRKSGLAKFIGGLALGAGLGVLFAPDKGENTRKVLKKKVDDLVVKIKDVDLAEVKDELLYKAETLKAELASLDKEKVKEVALEQANKIKAKAEELYKLAIEKGTPVVEKATDDVRRQALKVVKEIEKKLDSKKEK